MTVGELRTRQEDGERFQLIDVRSHDEYATGHIPCAVNLPMDQVEERLDDLHHHDPVVLICQSGRRAELTRGLLTPHVNDLIVLEGGTSAWSRAGQPLVSTGPARWAMERQVRLAAGVLVALGALLALTVDGVWAALPLVMGAGLAFAAITNVCGLASLLARMPWNQPRSGVGAGPRTTATCCR
jgi:rhodanese-related sulfurtransferase